MRVTINKRVYDTATAELIHTRTSGKYGDPFGYREQVYRTKNQKRELFVYGEGGKTSIYQKPTIMKVTKKRILSWYPELRDTL